MATAAVCCTPTSATLAAYPWDDPPPPPTCLYRAPPSRSPLLRLSFVRSTSCLPHAQPSTKRRKLQPTPPFRPFDSLPLELVESILRYLTLEELGRLKALSRSFNAVLSQSHLYETVHVPIIPPPHPLLVQLLPSILPGTRHLSLRSFTSSALEDLLPACTSRLTTLDLSFSGVSDADLLALSGPPTPSDVATFPTHSAASPFSNLLTLRLKGCRRVTSCSRFTSSVLPRIQTLDLSWSGVSSLPLPAPPTLQHLLLSSTPYLPPEHLSEFLSQLPEGLASLDLSHLALAVEDLLPLDFAPASPSLPASPDPLPSSSSSSSSSSLPTNPSSPAPLPSLPPLRLILAGNDLLTLSALARLKRTWATRFASSASRPGRPVEVEHGNMLLLESDDEEDVRRFVERVAGVAGQSGAGEGRATGRGEGERQ
ncbi:hypothetical protein JCM1841_005066 [Sporobolomyces salmonicolor]